MANSADPGQLASEEANWSGSTLFAKQGVSGFSRTRVNIYWTHCSVKTPKKITGKQWRPRSDAAECGIWSGSPLFANSLAIFL